VKVEGKSHPQVQATWAEQDPRTEPRLVLGGCAVDLCQEDEVIDLIVETAFDTTTRAIAIASANLDHIHHFGPRGLHVGQALVDDADLRWKLLIDGSPLAAKAAKRTGRRWPRLTGADLLWPILVAAADEGIRVGFLGGSEEMHGRLSLHLASTLPALKVVGMWAPSRAEVTDSVLAAGLAGRIREAGAEILVVGLGKPRQEVWIQKHGVASGARVLLAFGASADFLAGVVDRAPEWVRARGLEWAYRLAKEPRRLARRYLWEGPRAMLALAIRTGQAMEYPAEQRLVRSVAVIAVTYNSADEIDGLLDSIPAAAPGLRTTVIVVDNASTDRTVDRVAARGDALVVESGGNLGYAAAVNVGSRHIPRGFDAVAVLNPDLVLAPGSLRALADGLTDGSVGVTVPRVHQPDGTVFHSQRREPRILGAFGEALFGSRWARRPMILSDTNRDPAAYERAIDTEWASGAAWLIARDCDLAVGDWHEGYFLYSEEIDYARRVRLAGYRIRFVPDAQATHIGGASGSSDELSVLQAVNRVRDFEQCHGRWASVTFRGAVMLHHVVRSGRSTDRAVLRRLMARQSWSSLPGGTGVG